MIKEMFTRTEDLNKGKTFNPLQTTVWIFDFSNVKWTEQLYFFVSELIEMFLYLKPVQID